MSNAAVKRDTIAARRAGGIPQERARRRQAIVEAAVRVIEEHGTDTGLGTVADRAGLPRPHVYRHFASKGDLDQSVARHAARLVSAWIRPSLSAPGTPPEVVHGIVGRVLSWAVAHPNLYRFRARLGTAYAVPEITEAAVANLRAAGYSAHLPAYVVASVVGMVDAGIIWWFDHRDEVGPEQLNDWLAAQVWRVVAEAAQRSPSASDDG
ncbi:TetR/AcrR family transcriptional regulator [Verrucosispora sp. WMMD573]|uniref:TetR/AcrR family transcriptional regulator n=1 Tax=Verrucosispora sp. WMMD573 TaxID=3015149 RepID=UPI00248D27BC|nr:TetR/AcrR family transcriptional regulator [Verrucosispora sp. WMMD573]WBB51987.1 TetR/AcrR family transcriptional regulator [Verrucosispora sp. WMMD573]